MDKEVVQKRSNELLKVEAHMSSVPGFLHLRNGKTKNGKTKNVPPPICRPSQSSALQRAREFLPLMAKANDDVMGKAAMLPPGALDIENIDENAESLIEMDIALVEHDSDSSSLWSSADEASDDDGSDSDNNCRCPDTEEKSPQTDSALFNPVDENSMKLPGRGQSRKKPGIKVLSETASENTELRTKDKKHVKDDT